MIDCLIIGYNDQDFSEFVRILKSMGTHHPDFRDLNLNYVEYENKPYRALDIFTRFYYEGKKEKGRPFHNSDLLWMVVMYLGTYLAKRGFTFDYINLYQFEKEKLREKLLKNEYLAIAITTTIYNFDHPITEIISFIKEYNTEAKIVVGGPFVAKRVENMDEVSMKSLFKYIGADFFIYSLEGEQEFVDILYALKSKSSFHTIPNITYREGKEFFMTPARFFSTSLEENMIDYSLFPEEDIGDYVNIRISKGCPYSCAFCGFPTRAKKYQCASVERIRKEMRAIKDVGAVTGFFFIDDTVNLPKKRFKEILRMMIKEKFDFKWNCFFRSDQMDGEMVQLMKESGCEGVFLGLESANPTVLKNMNKNVGKEYYYRAIPMFKEAGIVTFISIFVGFPGETVDTFHETIEFLRETEADFYRPQLWYCDPVTPVWQEREKFGLKGTSFSWKHNTMDAATACDLMEEAMIKLDTPIWVPDPGYNFISLYIMRQRGVSFEKQRIFLRCFNAIVKEKILYPHRKDVSPQLIENLRRSCRYDEPLEIDMRPIQIISDTCYLQAESYLYHEYVENAPPHLNSEKQIEQPSHQGLLASKAILVDEKVLENLKTIYMPSLSDILLSAFGILIKVIERSGVVDSLVSSINGEVIPFRFTFGDGILLDEFMMQNARKREEAIRHHRFALSILTHPLWEKRYRQKSPLFRYGFLECDDENIVLKRLQQYTPRVYCHLGFALFLHSNQGIKVIYSSEKYREETIEQYIRSFHEILSMMSSKSDIPIQEIGFEHQKDELNTTIRNIASKGFNF